MQLELNFSIVLNPAPEQNLMVGDRVKRKGDPYSIYEVIEIAAGIANLKSIALGPSRRSKDLNAPLFNLIVVPVETVLEQMPPLNSVVLEQVNEQSAPEQFAQWIERYSPSNRKGYVYYRYVWMQGRKLHHIHIPGNVNGPTARRNYLEVELALAMGKAPGEISLLIKLWRKRID